ncbi:unnamed protein product [Ectocarpus sp. 6 AP-2014]
MVHISIHQSLIPQIAQANWLPLCSVAQIPRSFVKPIDLEYRKIGVFKTNDGQFKAIDTTCPHRHGDLGWAQTACDGAIICPYHGAKFSAHTGRCVDFLGSTSMLHARLGEYETRVDQDSVLWCKLTDGEVPFPELPPWTLPAGARMVHGTTDVHACAFDVVENLIDCVHVHKVHTFGNKEDPQPKNMKRVIGSRGWCAQTYDYTSGGTGRMLSAGKQRTVSVDNGFYGPFSVYSNVAFQDFQNRPKTKSIRVSVLPLSSTSTRMFWTIGRDFLMHDMFDHVARYVMQTTIAEDAAILRKMSGARPRTRQVLTKFDWIIAKYRQQTSKGFGSTSAK